MRLVENDLTAETTSVGTSEGTVKIADIWQAYKFLKPLIHHTPFLIHAR